MDFGKWAFNNQKLVSFLICVLLIGGIFSYWVLPKLEDPEIPVSQAMVVGIYPGASAHEVELELADPLEKAIRQMPNVEALETNCFQDMCMIMVNLQQTVPLEELEQHWDMLRRKVTSAAIPQEATVKVQDDFGDMFGMFFSISGDGFSDKELSDYAEFIKRELSSIEGIKRIDIYGQRKEGIRVTMKQDKLSQMGVSPLEILHTLQAQSATVYGGYFENGSMRTRVIVGDRATKEEEIANLIIQGHEGDQVRLSDLADVHREYDKPTRRAMTYDGTPALGMSISTSQGVDVTKLGKKVDNLIEELKDRLPAGVECNKVFFQPERVSEALNTFIINLIESVLLVVVVLMVFMGLKSGLIIGYSLVVIVLGSILVLKGMDGTLQRVSLASFILAMGMLVDNAIVIVDGVLVDKKRGLPRETALTSTAKKTAMPLLGATLIAILAFLPIFLSPDTTGLYVRDLFIVMAVSLLLSWILALVHVPLLCNKLLYSKKEKKEVVQNNPTTEEYQGVMYKVLRGMLSGMLSHRIITVTCAVALFVGCAYCYKYLPQGFFPDMNYNQMYMEYKLPEGNNQTRVEKDLKKIQEYLKTYPEITHITASTGGTPSRYNLVRCIATPSLSYGELIIDFTTPKALAENIETLERNVSEMFPDAYVKFKRYNLMYKKFLIEAQFIGPDPAILHQLSDSCRNLMIRTGAVSNITTDWEPKVPKLEVKYNQENAHRLGLSRKEVGASLMAATDGIPVGSFYDGIHHESIYLDCVDHNGEAINMLENASVFGLTPNLTSILNKNNLMQLLSGYLEKGKVVSNALSTTPLRQISDSVVVGWEDPVVIRYNGQRAQRVQCSPAKGQSANSAKAAIEKRMKEENFTLPEGYKLQWQGEDAASKSSMKYLFNKYPLAIILMIVILIMLFKDYKVPIIIFCCIPMILTGVIPAVLISGHSFGFVAIVGVLGLVGMMIKNGIVLMDEINFQIAEGKAPREALITSSLSRLRPVSMASVTTILGMIPLLPDAMFGSMAATIMGGLLAGTIIVLLLIPVLYAIFYKIK